MYNRILYYKHSIPPIYFGHSCGHFQRGASKRMDVSKYYKICEPMHSMHRFMHWYICWFRYHI